MKRTLILLLLIGCSREQRVENVDVSTAAPPATQTTATQTAAAEPATEPCVAAADRLCPVDEGATDPSFAAYREQLIAAVNERNEATLLALIDPKIRTSFGDGGGIDDFKKNIPWDDLAQILSLGGSFRGDGEARMFWAPYVYANWPEAHDAFQYVAAVRARVSIRREPDANASEVAVADWSILEFLPDPTDNKTWRHVKTKDGKAGWVSASDVRSPIGYRAGFSKRSGAWKMEALVAGD